MEAPPISKQRVEISRRASENRSSEQQEQGEQEFLHGP
jgi:hypothetical protein